jgi:hypothetical protein
MAALMISMKRVSSAEAVEWGIYERMRGREPEWEMYAERRSWRSSSESGGGGRK